MVDMDTKIAGASLVWTIFKDCIVSIKSLEQWIKGKIEPLKILSDKYVSHFDKKFDTIRILGMEKPIPLREVYVKVNILRKITSRRRLPIESLLNEFEKQKTFSMYSQGKKDGLDVINEFKKIIILGKPGAGKTTFLKRIALMALDRELHEDLIPIFISVHDWSNDDISLEDYIIDKFIIRDTPDPRQIVINTLINGKCLILLDGFDEVKGNVEDRLLSIRNFTEKYPENRFVLSCRIAAWDYVFENFVEVEMADFDEMQIKMFVCNWFSSHSSDVGQKKKELCWKKMTSNKRILEIASSPILLTMLCIAFDELLDFPVNRSELYKEAIEVLLKKWDSSRCIERKQVYQQLSRLRKLDLLSKIAFSTFYKNAYYFKKEILEKMISAYLINLLNVDIDDSEIESENVLKSIEAQHGLLIERANNIYSFSHLTFQEYLAATYIVENRSKGSSEDLINNHFLDKKWREIILLVSSMLDNADGFFLEIRNYISKITDTSINNLLTYAEQCILPSAEYTNSYCKILIFYLRFQRNKKIFEMLCTLAQNYDEQLAKLLEISQRSECEYNAYYKNKFRYPQKKYGKSRNLGKAKGLDRPLAQGMDISDIDQKKLCDFFYANNLLLECMNAESYILRETRDCIMDSILCEPWEEKELELKDVQDINDIFLSLSDKLNQKSKNDKEDITSTVSIEKFEDLFKLDNRLLFNIFNQISNEQNDDLLSRALAKSSKGFINTILSSYPSRNINRLKSYLGKNDRMRNHYIKDVIDIIIEEIKSLKLYKVYYDWSRRYDSEKNINDLDENTFSNILDNVSYRLIDDFLLAKSIFNISDFNEDLSNISGGVERKIVSCLSEEIKEKLVEQMSVMASNKILEIEKSQKDMIELINNNINVEFDDIGEEMEESFEKILDIENSILERIFAKIGSEIIHKERVLQDALIGANENIKKKLLSCLSSRSSDSVREDLEFGGLIGYDRPIIARNRLSNKIFIELSKIE